MGAYGVALLAKEQFIANMDMEYYSTILKAEELEKLHINITKTLGIPIVPRFASDSSNGL